MKRKEEGKMKRRKGEVEKRKKKCNMKWKIEKNLDRKKRSIGNLRIQL